MPRAERARNARALAAATGLGVCALAIAAAPGARAVIGNAHLVDGPDAALTGSVDAAMAEDGTGGVVYLKTIGGRDRVFAAQFVEGVWLAPQRVDVGQDFDSSWARIAAGDGGRLLVTWVQEFGAGTDRMFSATLDPGAGGFQSPVPVDLNLGEATSTFPDLAMNRGGQAYLVYNVITETSPSYPPGYLGLDVRLARYSNRLWSGLGFPVDRNTLTPMRAPVREIAPEVGIDVQGQGVVAWQEPDDEFVDRVWARRVFGNRVGIPLQASPSQWDGRPLRGAADAFSLDVAGFGAAAVAFRQQPGEGSTLDAPRLFVNELPEVFVDESGSFGGPRLVDGQARGGLGVPGAAVEPGGGFLAPFGSGPATLLASGDELEVSEVRQIDTAESSVTPEPVADLAKTGAAAIAWRELRGDVGLVRVQERRADGVVETFSRSGPTGGAVRELALGGSGLGDAVVGFSQGSGSNTQIGAVVLDAPPDEFLLFLPFGWQRKKRIPIDWEESRHAIGGVTYSVSVDDEPVIDGVEGLRAELKRDDVENGKAKVQVFAVDDAGQETGSLTGKLLVDRKPPKVKVRTKGDTVAVRVADGPKKSVSGVKRARISFGDGETDTEKGKRGGPARARHEFDRAGTYRVVVRAADKARNKAVVKRKVKVG